MNLLICCVLAVVGRACSPVTMLDSSFCSVPEGTKFAAGRGVIECEA